MPDISDKLPEFSTGWWMWWRNLQPSWRLGNGNSLSRQAPSDPSWSATEKGTANGFFMIVLALGWWALGLKYLDDSLTADYNDFSLALGDTVWVLGQMRLTSTSRKRVRENNDNGNIANKRFDFVS